MKTLDALPLPDGLIWVDEIEDSPVLQSQSFSLGGSKQFIQHQKLSRRNITLAGGSDHGRILRGDLLQLQGMADSNMTHTLVLDDGRTFSVRWNYPVGISASPILLKHNPDNNDPYNNVLLPFIVV